MNRADLHRLARYGVAGGASAATHFGVLVLLAEGLGVWPVAASTAGFAASIAVSYLLQRAWVFRSSAGHAVTGAKFLTVTAVAFGLNTGILFAGTEVLGAPYGLVQAVALAVIPVVNYVLNSRWTFAESGCGHDHPGHPGEPCGRRMRPSEPRRPRLPIN